MAALTQLSVLLLALINNIHAEELIRVKKRGDSFTFNLPDGAKSCLISRFEGEERLVLWNTSDLSQNSTAPEDLKQRLSVVGNTSSYTIHNLSLSDSGPYGEECWTDGKVTHEKKVSITVCSSVGEMDTILVKKGETNELPCWGADYDLDIHWLKREFGYEQEIWTKVTGDNHAEGKETLSVSNFTTTVTTVFTCLEMRQQQCVHSNPVQFELEPEVIYHSEDEPAVLPCAVGDEEPPRWFNVSSKTDLKEPNNTVYSVDQNYSLVFSSLTLHHSGLYSCQTSMKKQTYWLVVCPKFSPPAVQLFSKGEEVTLKCKGWEEGQDYVWFMKSNHTQGKVVSKMSALKEMSAQRQWDPYFTVCFWFDDASFFISSVSLGHMGEYWCAVMDRNEQCVSAAKTLLKYRGEIHPTDFAVRWSVLSCLLVSLSIAVVVVNRRTRRGQQLQSETDG